MPKLGGARIGMRLHMSPITVIFGMEDIMPNEEADRVRYFVIRCDSTLYSTFVYELPALDSGELLKGEVIGVPMRHTEEVLDLLRSKIFRKEDEAKS
jgi:hypothetical protein